MEEKEMIQVIDYDGLEKEVELVTFLNSLDDKRQYVVYTKGEIKDETLDQVIYISRFYNDNGVLKLEEIEDDAEWIDVQHLLKKIANAVD